jgi:serine/threonine protein kinase
VTRFLDREVAIKVIPSAVGSQDLTNRLFAEARASARLDHPNILPVFDYGDENGINFIGMPFVHGRTLEHIMAEAGGPLPLDATKTIVKQVASALDFAHAQGVVHRDVKPTTSTRSAFFCDLPLCLLELMAAGSRGGRLRDRGVLPIEEAIGILDDASDALEYAHSQGVIHRGLKPSSLLFGHNGFVYVSDFAFGARSSDLDRRTFPGAPDFLAPEQWESGAVTAAADQYSLAALAYLMLAGSPPFRGQQDSDIRHANFSRGPAPVHQEAARKNNGHFTGSFRGSVA